MIKILVLNGPNLNLLGIREPSVYGAETLDDINEYIDKYAAEQGVECYFFQSNCEGELIDAIQSVYYDFDGCILNAGAYTHYSYAIRDAISSIGKPVIEVHMSDIYKREEFRHISVIKDVCRESILGHGKDSYTMAVDAIKKYI